MHWSVFGVFQLNPFSITVFPHIVSAETILFWIWKSKGHSTKGQRSQYIKVRKLFKGGNYSRAETIWGNTVCIFCKHASGLKPMGSTQRFTRKDKQRQLLYYVNLIRACLNFDQFDHQLVYIGKSLFTVWFLDFGSSFLLELQVMRMPLLIFSALLTLKTEQYKTFPSHILFTK